jgi:hypothetical protein
MHVLCVLLIAQHVQCKPQYCAIVTAYQLIEGVTAPSLRLPDEFVILKPLLRPRLYLRWRQSRTPCPTCCRFRHFRRFYRDNPWPEGPLCTTENLRSHPALTPVVRRSISLE